MVAYVVIAKAQTPPRPCNHTTATQAQPARQRHRCKSPAPADRSKYSEHGNCFIYGFSRNRLDILVITQKPTEPCKNRSLKFQHIPEKHIPAPAGTCWPPAALAQRPAPARPARQSTPDRNRNTRQRRAVCGEGSGFRAPARPHPAKYQLDNVKVPSRVKRRPQPKSRQLMPDAASQSPNQGLAPNPEFGVSSVPGTRGQSMAGSTTPKQGTG